MEIENYRSCISYTIHYTETAFPASTEVRPYMVLSEHYLGGLNENRENISHSYQ
jgi:hypothetical protein